MDPPSSILNYKILKVMVTTTELRDCVLMMFMLNPVAQHVSDKCSAICKQYNYQW